MMTKPFSGDQIFNSGQTSTAELSKPPPSECPRCSSTNTKFCYYNNYNKSQPRHFCKSCKRHWTKGGTLRNIPAGRRRSNNRPRTSSSAAAPPAPRQENLQYSLSLSTYQDDDDDDMSNILFQALARSSSPSTITNSGIPRSTILESQGTTYIASSAPQHVHHQISEFTFSTIIPTFNYQSSTENLDSAEESTVTTSAAPPWPPVNPVDLWSWSGDIDFLGWGGDHFDAEITP